MVTVGIVIVIFLFLMIWASRYTKVGPNEVLVVSGRKHRYADPDGTRADARLPHRSRAAAPSSSRSSRRWTCSRWSC